MARTTPARGRQRVITLAATAPFTLYVVAFLGLPLAAVAVGAFQSPAGGFTLNNLRIATQGSYLHGLWITLWLAVITAVVPAILGLLIAYAVHTARRGALLRRVVVTASGVFANFGGVPLAFLFVAAIGSTGLVPGWLGAIGLNPYDHGFNLYTFTGVALVYLYFQVPLMVLVILPALEGLRPAWREAAENLGASSWRYWRHVGAPVLLPSVLGSALLLFGFGFAAYATAEALTSGTIPLTAIQIGSFLNGNVLSGQQNVGMALGLVMIIVIAVVMTGYALLQRRAARWLR